MANQLLRLFAIFIPSLSPLSIRLLAINQQLCHGGASVARAGGVAGLDLLHGKALEDFPHLGLVVEALFEGHQEGQCLAHGDGFPIGQPRSIILLSPFVAIWYGVVGD